MHFKSSAQRAYLFLHKPKLAKEWADKYGSGKNLPKHVKSHPKNKR